jgi:Outer membrane protein beta-barrel domain
LRKSTLFAAVVVCLFFAQFASAQQVDVFMGGGTLEAPSASANNASNPSMSGGTYLNIGGDVLPIKHFGVNVETAWLATQTPYGSGSGYNYRPILTDFNFLYQPHLGKRIGLDLMGGIGVADTRIYEQGESCSYCFESSDHFMTHLGGGVRFYVWRHVFVRPEVHYYYILDNNSPTDNGYFNSNSAVRVGASVGYTFGGGSD